VAAAVVVVVVVAVLDMICVSSLYCEAVLVVERMVCADIRFGSLSRHQI
jgi:hypothetical protein